MSEGLIIEGCDMLAEEPELLASIRRGFTEAQLEGSIPKLRDPPSGEEDCIYIGPMERPEGFATFYHAGHGRLWLDVLYVWPPFRRRGHGRRLLESVKRIAATDRFDVLLGTGIGNNAMRSLAVSAGFKAESIIYQRATGAGE